METISLIKFNNDVIELKEYYNEELADNPRYDDIDVAGFVFINHTKGISFPSSSDDHLLYNLETIYNEEDSNKLMDIFFNQLNQPL